MKASTPQVRGNICTDPNKPSYPTIEVDSDFWFSWLKESDVRSFNFESDQGKFTARKEERATSTNEYWYAYRKVHGKLRKVYLGSMDELTGDRLNQVAAEISQSGQDYYYSRKSYTTKVKQNCVTTADDQSLTLASNSYPTEDKVSWVTNNSELEALRLELDQVRSQLAKFQASEKDALDQLCTCHQDAFKAADILKAALKLKSNAGGAIKQEIRKALPLIDDV